MRVLLLTTDAYGGHGGIALYNRDLATALAEIPEVEEVVVIPRTLPLDPGPIPEKVRFVARAAGGKFRYVRVAWAECAKGFDLVICGHVNLLPLATLLNLRVRAPLVLLAYGIDVWDRGPLLARASLRWVRKVWSISDITRQRMNEWAGLDQDRFVLLPNAIHLDRYGLGDRRPELQARYGLHGRKVLMTLARLSPSERYKGIDEILDLMPMLSQEVPTLAYLIVGDGEDRPRLERRVRELGLEDRVVFTGFVSEADKADHFRLADVFAMPGRGEGFGFVFLEALACGVPVVGSLVDGSREALLDGLLGELVDPGDPSSVHAGIVNAFRKSRRIEPGMQYFAWPQFRQRLAAAVHSVHPTPSKAA